MARPTEHKPEMILAAARAVFYREGVAVSTARIAKAAGVSNGTLFNHFPTKQALIDALYVSIKNEIADSLHDLDPTAPIEQRMRQIWDRWFHWASSNEEAHAVMNLLHQSGLATAEAQVIGMAALEPATEVLHEADRQGALVDLPIDYLRALIQQHLDQAVISALNPAQAEIAWGVLWNGISARPPNTPTKDQS